MLAAASLLAVAAPALAAEPPKVSTGGIHLGGPICGPTVDEKSLAGRVVILELWGMQCAKAFKGDPLGTDATKLMVEWRKDSVFQGLVQCGQQLAQSEAFRGTAAGGAPVVTSDVLAALPPALQAADEGPCRQGAENRTRHEDGGTGRGDRYRVRPGRCRPLTRRNLT